MLTFSWKDGKSRKFFKVESLQKINPSFIQYKMSGPDCCNTEMWPCWRMMDHQDDCPRMNGEKRRSSLTCTTPIAACRCMESLQEWCCSLTLRKIAPDRICCCALRNFPVPCYWSSPPPLPGTGHCRRWRTPDQESVSTLWLLYSTNFSPHSRNIKERMKSGLVSEVAGYLMGNIFHHWHIYGKSAKSSQKWFSRLRLEKISWGKTSSQCVLSVRI